jgi:hypothetical protein
MTFITIIVILNLAAHLFLTRFFKKMTPDGYMTSTLATIILFIPPVSLFVSSFLISLGIIIRIFDKSYKSNKPKR